MEELLLMKIIKGPVKRRLYRLGYTISKRGEEITYLPISDYSQAIYSRKNILFEVDTDITFTPNQFFFAKSNWHYHTKMVEKIVNHFNVRYKGSLLEDFYLKYQPKTLNDFYFTTKIYEDLDESDLDILNQDITKYKQNSPWSDVRLLEKMDQKHEHGLERFHGIQSFGPVTKEKGELELNRLKSTYKSIYENGYQPDRFEGQIKGYFLKHNNNYRFMITNGIHRTAILAALNFEQVPVMFEPNFPRVIDFNDIKNFPQVRNKVFSVNLTQKIFLSYFEDKGIKKAKKLNLTE